MLVTRYEEVLTSIEGIRIKEQGGRRAFKRMNDTSLMYGFSYQNRHFELWLTTYVDRPMMVRNFIIQDASDGTLVETGPSEVFTKTRIKRSLKNYMIGK